MEINCEDAAKLGIKDGEVVRVISRRGSITPQAEVTDRVKPGLMFIAMHYKEAAANVLTKAVYDPVSNSGIQSVSGEGGENKLTELEAEEICPLAVQQGRCHLLHRWKHPV